MHYREKTIAELSQKISQAGSKRALVGLDGFVDKIMLPVAQRQGPGEAFTPFPTLETFGQRIVDAAGKSCNIELFPKMEKLGGNGPIMANAMAAAGVQTRYLGALGDASIHPVFEAFAQRTQAISLADPGITHALEFTDGKVMLGTMASLDEITYERVIEKVGEGAFIDLLSRSDVVAMVNWTMIPYMTSILSSVLERVLPSLPPAENGRIFFFDLTDPRKRSDSDLLGVLSVIGRYRSYGSVTLGLNLAEAKQVYKAIGMGELDSTPEALRSGADQIRQKLEIHTVVIHPRESAACATRDGTWFTHGPLTENPLITTGAGDHFNAGYVTGQLLGLSPEACLTVAVSFSGQYVRTAKSPSLSETVSFLQSWSNR